MTLDAYYEFRTRLADALATDLVGPTAEDEVIPDAPITRYISGILYPQLPATVDPDQDLDPPDDDAEIGAADPPVAMANVRYPSSMGLTFAVDLHAANTIEVSVTAGRYHPVAQDGADEGRRFRRRAAPGPTEEWQREGIGPEPLQINLGTPTREAWEPLADGLSLFRRIREPGADGTVSVTIILVNTNQASPGEPRDALAFFQPCISVKAVGSPRAFVERPAATPPTTDPDLLAYRLLYRHARGFAIGHGCSVEWDVTSADGERASSLRTTFAPRCDLQLADSNPEIRARCLEIHYLSTAAKPEALAELDRFCAGYQAWIDARRTEADALRAELQPIAATQIRSCEEALARMRRGVHLLAEDPVVWEAFSLMNRAMLQQRARSTWLRGGRPEPGPREDSDHKWRPFQLAFILLCLAGIARPVSEDRAVADLLWFPTGGGKTEAYLGLIALTVFLRRLRLRDSGTGVTALMRYTLRLVTIQQFERAALLICCCDNIRRSDPGRLGAGPIAVGLWVGQGGTPNTRREARQSLDKLRSGAPLETSNPVQLHACPWCGTPLDHRNYFIAKTEPRLIVACRNKDCAFRDGVPVFVVDEDIYDYRPALLIATVDKFASLPWREKVSALFNLGNTGHHPPELIIQDELHLISGPLGTLTALYETAVDALCSRDGIRPKVIASTATIRRAGAQGLNLFDRTMRQFPPAGLDARDSYFATEARREAKGTRLYVGLMAPGTSQTTLLVRTYANLLEKSQELKAAPEVKDPYWTLVGYFNSLRVLGGARLQVQDDVTERIALLAREAGTPARSTENTVELTSREHSADIPERLKQMAVEHPDPGALDVILATNMISVGVDIDRLGLMVVMGQPQSTSEYIQATSRVGRRHPGLIVVLFNAAKSRDRSHYEAFVSYHSALYRQVESTSVTPFSSRARGRALHAVFVALARHLVAPLHDNTGAAQVEHQIADLTAIRGKILDRVARVAPEELTATEAELNEILEHWRHRAENIPGLVFSDETDPDGALLVDAARDDVDPDTALPTLWSLRDVDRASGLYIVGGRDAE